MRLDDDAAPRLPIKLDPTSNGEFVPVPLPRAALCANDLAAADAAAHAHHVGYPRRAFLASACGAASTLLAFNRAFALGGPRGGFYQVAPEAALEPAAAAVAVGGDEFIFDVQTHHVNPDGPWRRPLAFWNMALRTFPQARCDSGLLNSIFGSIECFSAQHFVKNIFLDSDTDLAVLSFVPALPEDAPLTILEGSETRGIVEGLEGTQRLLLHGAIHPNVPGELEKMDEVAERWQIAAWKTYTQFGPGGKGYWLDDEEFGVPFIEKARALGIKIICVHKGLSFPNMEKPYAGCRDIGVVAKRFPDMTFIVYHSGFEPDLTEGPYSDDGEAQGIDGMIRSLREHDVPPNSNVYAELGSTWRYLMRDPDAAAHSLGKLFTHVGQDRVLWGTDSIWYGSPQDQIQAFRTFQISEAFREQFGYPEITPHLRAQVFGLNATVPYRISPEEVQRHARADRIQAMKATYAEAPAPTFRTYGPQTRREFLRFLRLHPPGA